MHIHIISSNGTTRHQKFQLSDVDFVCWWPMYLPFRLAAPCADISDAR